MKTTDWKGYKIIVSPNVAQGAYGDIYRAQKNGTDFCIKVMSKKKIQKVKEEKHAQNEINILKQLSKTNHPNLLHLVEFQDVDNRFYLVSDYYNGGDLDRFLQQRMDTMETPFDEKMVQHVMKQVLNGLNFLHTHQILHRDLSLENLVIHYNSESDKEKGDIFKGRIILVDFGFARVLKKGELAATNIGDDTNAYKDPNLILSQIYKNKKVREAMDYEYDEKMDIWSLGILCYEMLMGYTAFKVDEDHINNSASKKERKQQILNELLSKIQKGYYFLPSNIHQETFDFIQAMLQFDARRRASTAQLLRFPFITSDVSQFHNLDLKNVKLAGDDVLVNTGAKKGK